MIPDLDFIPISGDDLAGAIDFLELTPEAFAYSLGEPVAKVEAWLGGLEAVPHWASLVTLLLSVDTEGVKMARDHSTAAKRSGMLIEDVLASGAPSAKKLV